MCSDTKEESTCILSPCNKEANRPWTHCQASGRDANNNITYSFDDRFYRNRYVLLPSKLASICTP